MNKIYSKRAYDIVTKKIQAAGKPRSAFKIATYLKNIYNEMGKYVKLVDNLLQVEASDKEAVIGLLVDMQGHMTNIREYITHVRKPIRRVIDYCYGEDTEDKDKIRERRIKNRAYIIDDLRNFINLHTDIVKTKTDNDFLEYLRNNSINILTNVEPYINDRTKSTVKLAFNISRVMASYYEAHKGKDDQLSIKTIRSLWGEWAVPFAQTYELKKELENLFDKLNNTDDTSRELIAEVLIDIDQILDRLNTKSKEVIKMF